MLTTFDIETEPLDDEHLERACPEFDESDEKYQVTEFDESAVKLGNLKDQAKIDAKIEAARADHQKKMDLIPWTLKKDKEAHLAAFKDRAALDPCTGRILAIGFMSDKGFKAFGLDSKITESDLLSATWNAFVEWIREGRQIIGHNILDFDLWFMVARSNILGVKVPPAILAKRTEKWPAWNRAFIDTGKVWLCGRHAGSSKWNFNHLSAAFGTQGKFDGIDGKDFATLYREDPATAFEYLKQDCEQPLIWAQKMGVK